MPCDIPFHQWIWIRLSFVPQKSQESLESSRIIIGFLFCVVVKIAMIILVTAGKCGNTLIRIIRAGGIFIRIFCLPIKALVMGHLDWSTNGRVMKPCWSRRKLNHLQALTLLLKITHTGLARTATRLPNGLWAEQWNSEIERSVKASPFQTWLDRNNNKWALTAYGGDWIKGMSASDGGLPIRNSMFNKRINSNI